MARRRRRRRAGGKWRFWWVPLAALPALYLLAALVGSLLPVNRGWVEPEQGITVYLADNGIHADLVMPARAAGLDWTPLVPKSDFAAPDPAARWIAFGAGEERVYLDTPTWWDLTPRTLWAALTGGDTVIHVEWVADPKYALRQIRLRPEEYRRLWAAPISSSTSAVGPGGSTTPAMAAPTRSTAVAARRARSAPATAGWRAGCASPG